MDQSWNIVSNGIRCREVAGTDLEIPQGAASSRLRALLPSLRSADAKVARFALDEPVRILAMTVTDVAAATGTSAATVVRACQSLGYGGYNDLKLALAREAGDAQDLLSAELEPGDPPAVVLEKVLGGNAAAIRESGEIIDKGEFERAVELIDGAAQILVVAVGTSSPLAQDAAYRLVLLGLKADAPADIHVQHVKARALTAGDLCLAISHTGQTTETLGCVETAREAGATTVGITSFLRSPLTEQLDVALVASCKEIGVRLEAMASRIAHLSVLDALCAAVALRRGEAATAALERGYATVARHRL
jgi:DNA-binding MurR/RpiR family transcriptional regulator